MMLMMSKLYKKIIKKKRRRKRLSYDDNFWRGWNYQTHTHTKQKFTDDWCNHTCQKIMCDDYKNIYKAGNIQKKKQKNSNS